MGKAYLSPVFLRVLYGFPPGEIDISLVVVPGSAGVLLDMNAVLFCFPFSCPAFWRLCWAISWSLENSKGQNFTLLSTQHYVMAVIHILVNPMQSAYVSLIRKAFPW